MYLLGFLLNISEKNVHLMHRANKDVSLIRFCLVMLLILSKYSSEKNLIDDEGTIIQTLTFSLNVAMQKGEKVGKTKVKYISLQIIKSVYFPTAI